MSYQKVCYTSPVPWALEILIIALFYAPVIVRLRHQGFLVPAAYGFVAWIWEGERGLANVVLAGVIHLVAISGCFLYTLAARQLRPAGERALPAGSAGNREGTQTPFAMFAA